jgi:Zn-dependent protease
VDWGVAILLYGVFVISTVFHEAAHALLAYLGGDRTAYLGGQVSLNPVPHVRREPFGMVVLPVMSLLMSRGYGFIGFASTPLDPLWAARHPKRAAVMAAAGPVTNLLLAAIAFAVLKILIETGQARPTRGMVLDMVIPVDPGSGGMFALCRMASAFLYMNVFLALLNLLPVPPLDGGAVLEGLLPREAANALALVRSQPILAILILYFLWTYVISPLVFLPLLQLVRGWF